MPTPPLTTHYNTRQLADRWHMSPGTLMNWRSAGIGPDYIKVGARVLYPLFAIEAYETARLIETSFR